MMMIAVMWEVKEQRKQLSPITQNEEISHTHGSREEKRRSGGNKGGRNGGDGETTFDGNYEPAVVGRKGERGVGVLF